VEENQGVTSRRIRAGRGTTPRALITAAIPAARLNPYMDAFCRRLLEQRKAKKVVLIAVARKLDILAHTLIS